MFKNKFEMGRLFSPESDSSGGGSSTTNNQGGADDATKSVTGDIDVQQLLAENAALKAHNAKVIAEKQKKDQENVELARKLTAEERALAEKEQNFKRLYEITLEDVKVKDTQLQDIERQTKEADLKKAEDLALAVLLQEIGPVYNNAVLLRTLKEEGLMKDLIPDANGKNGFNDLGKKKIADYIREKHNYMLQVDTKTIPANQAKSTATTSNDTFAERAKRLGIGGMNKK